MVHKKHSLRRKILLPLILMILLEGVLIYTVLYFSGTMRILKENAYKIFEEIVQSRSGSLNNDIVNRWSGFEEELEAVQQEIEGFLQTKGISGSQLVPGNENTSDMLESLAPFLTSITQKNNVTGVFLVLEGDGGEKKSGLYFRDLNPETVKADYSDLVALRGSSMITRQMGISLDGQWRPIFEISSDEENSAFYNTPFQTAKKDKKLKSKDLGYWCPPFQMNGERYSRGEIITYSVPIQAAGEVQGVMGIEITSAYLSEQIPYLELNEGEGAGYFLMKKEGSNYEIMVSSQGSGLTEIKKGQTLTAKPSEWDGFYRMTGEGLPEGSLMCAKELQMYYSNVPYEGEEWLLAGVVQQKTLLTFFRRFEQLFLLVVVSVILLAMAAAAFAANRLTAPITALNRKLKNSNMGKRIWLDKVHIAEIDDLTNTIERLSNEVVDHASRLGTLLDMAGVSIGVCEYTVGKEEDVFCTRGFLRMFHYPGEYSEGTYLPAEKLKQWMKKYEKCVVEYHIEEQVTILELKGEHPKRWIRYQKMLKGNRMLGVAADVTSDMIEKKKIEWERDFDLLTNLYNRRAFQSKVSACFAQKGRLGIAAMIMIDLDNLKYINDSYGHDCGDEYIRTTAEVMRRYKEDHAILGRLSGDEFMIFVYGQKAEEQIRDKIRGLFKEFHDTTILLPDGSKMPLRASAGIAWYPKDTDSLEELKMYADFAMYSAKKTNKGGMEEFDREKYKKESYLLHGKEELNLLLEDEQVNYAYQPIVDCRTGEIFAYEALMRPDSENIKSPMELLSLARSQSKLHQVEKLTMFKSMEGFVRMGAAVSDVRIFINSIANQTLSGDEVRKFEQKYQKYLSRIVIEITEEEQSTNIETANKRKICSRWGAEIAIDDYGEGYSNESILLEMEPQYVKIDRIMIHDIHRNDKQRSLLHSILSYTKAYGIKTIAEGVECREEMEILIQEGIDYLQGYYLGRPRSGPAVIAGNIKKEIFCAGKKTF